MKRRVLIAGVGQLGSRYLQGLSKVIDPLEIWVFDISPDSLIRAEERWAEMQTSISHEVVYITQLDQLPASMDLAIVATTADVRVRLITQIAKVSEIQYWILEKILAQSIQQLDELYNLLREKSVWVNTPMHLWSLYQKIRNHYKLGTLIEASFEGFRGLVCNAIHYIDFVSRWNGARLLDIDVSNLNPFWFEAKRKQFFEIDGRMYANFDDGSRLKLSTERHIHNHQFRLKIDGIEWLVNEAEGVANSSNGRTILGDVELQSQLTAPLVKAIFLGEPCGLPTLTESIQQHAIFLKTMIDHWNTHMPNKVERLPIT
jgi:hypothetical protein